MRILTKKDAKRIDVEFIYKEGNAIAILDKDFDDKFDIIPKKK